jgi:autotransporter-associated beta strand protein
MPPVSAISIAEYDPAVNDRFTGGFPAAPLENQDGLFVGLPYDLSGVGWSASDPTKGFGFFSPRHYLVASHYGGAAGISVVGADGAVVTATQQAVVPTGLGFSTSGGDISVGRLTAPLPGSAALPRYAVLDLNATSTSDSLSAYAGLPLLVYGRGAYGSPPGSPRAVEATVFTASDTAYASPNTGYMLTRNTTFLLEMGDSGSPLFARLTNPDGRPELAIIGSHSAVDVTNGINVHNFLGRRDVIDALNGIMTADGFALRVTGTTRATWEGGSNTSIGNRQAWGLPRFSSAPSDAYVLFDADTAAGRTVTVDAARTLRGLSFGSSVAAADGFLFSGTATLTVGRGGITNYDGDRQVVGVPLALGDHQYWDVGPGGVTVGGIATQGRLLEVAGSGTAVVTGAISGSGALSVSGPGTVRLDAVASHTGATRVFGGTLALGAGAGIAGSRLVMLEAGAGFDVTALGSYAVPAGQTLAGSGTVLGSVEFGAGATLSPGRDVLATLVAGGGPAATVLTVPEPAALAQGLAGLGFVAGALWGAARRRDRAARGPTR